MHDGFRRYAIGLGADAFAALSAGVDFEDVAPGRLGTHLVDVSPRGVPLVRTTSRYSRPAGRFSAAHRQAAAAVRAAVGATEGAAFDNALIEIYDRAYCKMGYHCDQALDLAPGSLIAVYTCYERPLDASARRTLEIRDKVSRAEASIVLEHDTAVVFSLDVNARHVHRIVLRSQARSSGDGAAPDNRWLGLTLRSSKTHIRFGDDGPRFADGRRLTLADETQRRTFYRLRGQENREVGFVYPRVDFTISAADLLPPAGLIEAVRR